MSTDKSRRRRYSGRRRDRYMVPHYPCRTEKVVVGWGEAQEGWGAIIYWLDPSQKIQEGERGTLAPPLGAL